MASEPFSEPITGARPRVEEIEVGEDLHFQRRWWIFERCVWIFFLLILIADAIGVFGRGLVAKAQISDAAHLLTANYERVERADTPSVMTLHIASQAIRDGQVDLFVSENVTRSLGALRISPQPLRSALTNGGIDYTFAAASGPAVVEFQLQPLFPGLHRFRIALANVPHPQILQGKVFVVP